MEFCDRRTGDDVLRSEDETCLMLCDGVSKWVDIHSMKRSIFSNLAETSRFYGAHVVSDHALHLKRWCSLARDTQRSSFGMCAIASRVSLFSAGTLMHWWRMLSERRTVDRESLAGSKTAAGAVPLILFLLAGIFVPAVSEF
ncbi:hypothetical protein [uncultured Gimesia sp.]|uniref:hypothetical protein n=1 Tax=uncultured Gimesia sp. TaxID=1678688 RepID=UPI0030DC354E